MFKLGLVSHSLVFAVDCASIMADDFDVDELLEAPFEKGVCFVFDHLSGL